MWNQMIYKHYKKRGKVGNMILNWYLLLNNREL